MDWLKIRQQLHKMSGNVQLRDLHEELIKNAHENNKKIYISSKEVNDPEVSKLANLLNELGIKCQVIINEELIVFWEVENVKTTNL